MSGTNMSICVTVVVVIILIIVILAMIPWGSMGGSSGCATGNGYVVTLSDPNCAGCKKMLRDRSKLERGLRELGVDHSLVSTRDPRYMKYRTIMKPNRLPYSLLMDERGKPYAEIVGYNNPKNFCGSIRGKLREGFRHQHESGLMLMTPFPIMSTPKTCVQAMRQNKKHTADGLCSWQGVNDGNTPPCGSLHAVNVKCPPNPPYDPIMRYRKPRRKIKKTSKSDVESLKNEVYEL